MHGQNHIKFFNSFNVFCASERVRILLKINVYPFYVRLWLVDSSTVHNFIRSGTKWHFTFEMYFDVRDRFIDLKHEHRDCAVILKIRHGKALTRTPCCV